MGFKAARLQIYAYFHEHFDNEIKCILMYNNQKESFYTLSMAHTIHFYFRKRSKLEKKAFTALITQ
jgi:hypothetical protein